MLFTVRWFFFLYHYLKWRVRWWWVLVVFKVQDINFHLISQNLIWYFYHTYVWISPVWSPSTLLSPGNKPSVFYGDWEETIVQLHGTEEGTALHSPFHVHSDLWCQFLGLLGILTSKLSCLLAIPTSRVGFSFLESYCLFVCFLASKILWLYSVSHCCSPCGVVLKTVYHHYWIGGRDWRR